MKPSANGGFTLVEILVTLAIFATLLTLLLSAFTGAARTREALADRSRAFRQVGIVIDRIGSDIEGAVSSARRPETALTCKEDQFSGKPAATLVFTAFSVPETTGSRPSSDLVKVKYYTVLSEDGSYLELYREQADLPLVENRMDTRRVRMAQRLQAFRVELYDGTKWVKEWPSGTAAKGALPKRVAFTIVDERARTFRRVVPVPLAGQEESLLHSGRRPGQDQGGGSP